MSSEPSGVRERVQQAIAGPIAESEKLLADLQDGDAETRLSILLSGWFRGVAAALEELAIAVDDLLAQSRETTVQRAPAEQNEEPLPSSPSATAEHAERIDLTDAGVERLSEEAKKSREETTELRKESERERRRLER
jgi:methyl-accepting chemotaxis protein